MGRRRKLLLDGHTYTDICAMNNMFTKGLFIITFLLCAYCVNISAQTPTPEPPKVLVSQSFLDDSAKAFALVVSLRDALQKEQMANGASAVTKAALQSQIDALNSLIVIFERKDVIYQSLLDLRDQAFKTYERIIAIQTEMIERLTKQLNRGKSGWDKFLGVLKTVAVLLSGYALGHGGILK